MRRPVVLPFALVTAALLAPACNGADPSPSEQARQACQTFADGFPDPAAVDKAGMLAVRAAGADPYWQDLALSVAAAGVALLVPDAPIASAYLDVALRCDELGVSLRTS